MPAEVMSSSSSNDALGPTVNQPPRRSYLAIRTRQVKLIPTAEALKLLSGTRAGHCRKVIRKLTKLGSHKILPLFVPPMQLGISQNSVGANHGISQNMGSHKHGNDAEVQTWDLTKFCTSNAQSGTMVSSTNATSHSVGANHTETGNAHLQTQNPNMSTDLCGVPVESAQNAGVRLSKTKGKGRAVGNKKRNLVPKDGQSSGKRGCGVAMGYKR